MSPVGGQHLQPTGPAVQINPYPAGLRVLVGNARSALYALGAGVDAMDPGLDSISIEHLARDVDGLYPLLDHVGNRVGEAQTERMDDEHDAVAAVARALMRPVDQL